MEQIWECMIIGDGSPLNPNYERALVRAIKNTYKELSGVDCDFCLVSFLELHELQPTRVEIIEERLGESAKRQRIWQCKIGGEIDGALPEGSDLPMRLTAYGMYNIMTQSSQYVCFSGWSAALTEEERKQVAA